MKQKSIPLLFYLPEDIKEAVEKLADRRGLSQGAVCRIALTRLLEETHEKQI